MQEIAKCRVLAIEPMHDPPTTKVHLVLVSPGYEPAGAGMRRTNGYIGVNWEMFGATQGRRFRVDAAGEDAARAMFDKLTHRWINVSFR